MIFRDKPLSALYIDLCLTNPPAFPGTFDTTRYIDNLHYETLGGTLTLEEISERVGEIWGSVCSKVVIATCIVSYNSKIANNFEKKSLKKSFDKFLQKQNNIINLTRHIGKAQNNVLEIEGREIELPDIKLDTKILTDSAAKSSQFLLSARNPDVVLEYERTVGEKFRALRVSALNEFSPVSVREKLHDGIEELTGLRPK